LGLKQSESITINREGAGGTYVDGHRVSAADDVTTTLVNIQPLGGSDLIQLADSDRLRQPIRIYSSVELKESDLITRDKNGRQYEILKVSDLTPSRIPHYKSIGLLIDAQ
jgi:hypothetical protein